MSTADSDKCGIQISEDSARNCTDQNSWSDRDDDDNEEQHYFDGERELDYDNGEEEDDFSQHIDEYLQNELDDEIQRQLDKQIQSDQEKITERIDAMVRNQFEEAMERELQMVMDTVDSHTDTDTDRTQRIATNRGSQERNGLWQRKQPANMDDLIRLLQTNNLDVSKELQEKSTSTSVQDIDERINVIIDRYKNTKGS